MFYYEFSSKFSVPQVSKNTLEDTDFQSEPTWVCELTQTQCNPGPLHT